MTPKEDFRTKTKKCKRTNSMTPRGWFQRFETIYKATIELINNNKNITKPRINAESTQSQPNYKTSQPIKWSMLLKFRYWSDKAGKNKESTYSNNATNINGCIGCKTHLIVNEDIFFYHTVFLIKIHSAALLFCDQCPSNKS